MDSVWMKKAKKLREFIISPRFWTTPIKHQPYELFFMRITLVYTLWKSFIFSCRYTRIVIPTGLSHFIDFSFLCENSIQPIWQVAFLVSSFLYTFKVNTVGSLLVMLFIHNGMFTLNNSQGSIGHTYQILTLILVAQVFFYGFQFVKKKCGYIRKGFKHPNNVTDEDMAVWYTQQMLMAIYVMCAITKHRKSEGEWMSRTTWILPQLVKANDMKYFNFLEGGFDTNWLAQLFVNLSLQTYIVPLIFFGGAFMLELLAFLFLFNRTSIMVGGAACWLLHWGIKQMMTLDFCWNQYVISIYLLYIPYVCKSLWERLTKNHSTRASRAGASGPSPPVEASLPRFNRKLTPPMKRKSKRHRNNYVRLALDVYQHIPFKVCWLFIILFLIFGENYPFSSFPMYSASSPKSYLVYITDNADTPLALNRDHKIKASHVNKYLKNVKLELMAQYNLGNTTGFTKDQLLVRAEQEGGVKVLEWFVEKAKRAHELSTRKPLHLYWRDIIMDDETNQLSVLDRRIASLPCTYHDHLECQQQQLSCCFSYVNQTTGDDAAVAA